VAAIFIANVPESLSASVGLRRRGYSPRYIVGIWVAVAVSSAVAAAVGYELLGGASGEVLAVIEAFAAGAILTMLADTMMPEAFEFGGSTVGLATVLGFGTAFLLTTL
jgi:ZIP family zinc transporter